jgi:predicted nucleic acid-binding protein
MSARIFVDTNILVYCRDSAKPEKQKRADEWISYLWQTGNGRLSMQVISEYYSVVTGKIKPGLDTTSAREDVTDLLTWQPLPLTAELIDEAWKLQDQLQLSWWDSLIVAAAITLRCEVLLSEDFQHGQIFYGLKVVNPFLMMPYELALEE